MTLPTCRIALALAFCLLAHPLQGEAQAQRLKVYMAAQCSGNSVGQTMFYSARQAVAASQTLELVHSIPAADLGYIMICLDHGDGDVAYFSWNVLTHSCDSTYPHLVDSGVGMRGADVVGDFGTEAASKIDAAGITLRDRIEEGKHPASCQR
jgi:hypothetical protein